MTGFGEARVYRRKVIYSRERMGYKSANCCIIQENQ